MDFYKTMADYYDYIFPLNREQVNMISEDLGEEKDFLILDVGCATGNLSRALVQQGHRVYGIDLEKKMIDLARERTKKDSWPRFLHLDMLEIGKEFSPETFKSIVCFGNTLVHLQNKTEIKKFFSAVYDLLQKEGFFYFQIVNYNRIKKKKIKELPVIDNEVLRFERFYDYPETMDYIKFCTHLYIKKTNETFKKTTTLKPLFKEEISSSAPQKFPLNNFNKNEGTFLFDGET